MSWASLGSDWLSRSLCAKLFDVMVPSSAFLELFVTSGSFMQLIGQKVDLD